MITAAFARLVSPMVAVPLILAAIGGVYGWGYLKGFTNAKDRSALLFERAMTKAQQEADHRVQEALDAAENVDPVSNADGALLKLCERRRACRSHKG